MCDNRCISSRGIFLLGSFLSAIAGSGGGFALFFAIFVVLTINGVYLLATRNKPIISINYQGIYSKRTGFINWSSIEKIFVSTDTYSSGVKVENLSIQLRNGEFHTLSYTGLTDRVSMENFINKYYSRRNFY